MITGLFELLCILSPLLLLVISKNRLFCTILAINLSIPSIFGETVYYLGYLDSIGAFHFFFVSIWSFICSTWLYVTWHKIISNLKYMAFILINFMHFYAFAVLCGYLTSIDVFYNYYTQCAVIYNVLILLLIISAGNVTQSLSISYKSPLHLWRNYNGINHNRDNN